jgi:hypothetical protein
VAAHYFGRRVDWPRLAQMAKQMTRRSTPSSQKTERWFAARVQIAAPPVGSVSDTFAAVETLVKQYKALV